MSLNTKIALKIEAVDVTQMDQGVSKILHELELALGWPDGTAVNTANEVWSDSRTITAAAFENFDLTALAQLDDGAVTLRTIDFATIKAILIKNTSTAGRLRVGGGTNNGSAVDAWALNGAPWISDASMTDIPFGGWFAWGDPTGVAVTGTSADILSLGALVANQTYEMVIIGKAT